MKTKLGPNDLCPVESNSIVLDAQKSLSREDKRWSWSGTNAHGAEVSLGSIELRGESLVLETNSKARG